MCNLNPLRSCSLRYMGIRVPSPCMQGALLGPCFKTGPTSGSTDGGPWSGTSPRNPIHPWLVRRCDSPKGSSRASQRLTSSRHRSPGPAPHAAVRLHVGALSAGDSGGRATIWTERRGPNAGHPGTRVLLTTSSATLRQAAVLTSPVRTPLAQAPHRVEGRVHRKRLDGLLAALAGCFAHFPHGTCMLSGSVYKI